MRRIDNEVNPTGEKLVSTHRAEPSPPEYISPCRDLDSRHFGDRKCRHEDRQRYESGAEH
jgi:hypothetical protein